MESTKNIFTMSWTAKKLVKMARKLQKETLSSSYCNERMTNKGHFVVYTADHYRFVIPLQYLNTDIFKELLKMSEDELGLPRNGPIILVCDSMLMSYLINMLERGLSKDLEKALFVSIASNHCSLLDHGGKSDKQSLVCGF